MNTEIFTNPGSHDFHSTWRWLHLRFVCLSKQFWYHIWFESYLVQFGDKLKNLSPGWVRNSYYESMMIRNHCSSSWHMICRIYLIHDNPRFSTLQKHRRWSLCPTFQRQRSSFCCRRQFSTKIFYWYLNAVQLNILTSSLIFAILVYLDKTKWFREMIKRMIIYQMILTINE